MRVLVLLAACVVWVAGRTQRARVTGKLLCGDEPVSQATVNLYDEDTLSRDELMGTTKTNSNGEFEVSGEASDPLLTTIEPYVEIQHQCEYGLAYGKGKRRKTEFYVPSRYVDLDEGADIGTVNLQIRYRAKENSWLRYFF